MRSSTATPQARRLHTLTAQRLAGIGRGLEKESLRAQADGRLALTPHPPALGSALTHPNITTDYSESQLELITGVNRDADGCIRELTRIHQFVDRALGAERLWVSSMPCHLPVDETIPIARYGRSNIGHAKSVYRMGLGHRYGRRMQTISGIHYNWSLPGLGNDDYFGLIRNFRRHAFVLLTLFGASPAVCSSFVGDRDHGLQRLAPGTFGRPHATSLRMGRLGYQSDAQAALCVSYNDLEGYAASLHEALTRPHPPYEAIGVRNPGGEYNQLATTLLQIENEFYGTIRPKRVVNRGERPLHALRDRGVEYIEVRCLDLNPFLPVGIDAQTLRFIDVFLLHCLLADSPPDSPDEIAALSRNQEKVASRGREPGLRLEHPLDGEVALVDWAASILAECGPIADALDAMALEAGQREPLHASALHDARRLLADLSATPSARVLQAMTADFAGEHSPFVAAQSRWVRQHLRALPWSHEDETLFVHGSDQSLAQQRAIEAADSMPFEAFRQAYVSPDSLMPRSKAA
jgi:glutamate--cysteine ligase